MVDNETFHVKTLEVPNIAMNADILLGQDFLDTVRRRSDCNKVTFESVSTNNLENDDVQAS